MLDDIEHALLETDVHMGELNTVENDMYVFSDGTLTKKTVRYNTGLLKLFDEIITNAIDNLQRGSGIKNISVEFTENSISVFNDGNSIPIEMNTKHNLYIPEMIFTKFRAGSNFRKAGKDPRITGGKNGIGSKLVAVFSKTFDIEIVNGGKMYKQHVHNNCRSVDRPVITKTKEDDYVMITYTPDYERLKMTERCLSPDVIAVMSRRVYDLTHLPIDIMLNGDLLPRLSWDDFMKPFGIFSSDVFTFVNERWRVSFGMSRTGTKFHQISYVNNICSYEGGYHVGYIVDQIIKYIRDQYPEVADVSTTIIKNHLAVVIYAVIENPLFKGQTKTDLSTKPDAFGSKCDIPYRTLEAFCTKTSIIKDITPVITQTKIRQKSKITDVEKLVEANKAGKEGHGHKCTLFICEGLSAMTMCLRGIGNSNIGHDYFGCYPMRGKVLNPRGKSDDVYKNNRVLTDLKNIIGLTDGMEYDNVSKLRYGKVVCVKDADTDGAAIMGLVINFFHLKFPSLLKIEGFFSEFITPVICIRSSSLPSPKQQSSKGAGRSVATKGFVEFYNDVEYRNYMKSSGKALKNVEVQFFKGLATIEPEDTKRYFSEYSKNTIAIRFEDEKYPEWMNIAYGKDTGMADVRKKWIKLLAKDAYLPREKGGSINVVDFINNDLRTYSREACEKSIPSCIDGLKPSQRKILYTLFKSGKSAYEYKKIFQLGGKVTDFANYHHGEASIFETIIGMAQNYPCSGNNINLLTPYGEMGTRNDNGGDHGAPRYVGATLNRISRDIFPSSDDELVDYKMEDNESVEPYYYVPIIPIVLVNGARGLGTGWSTLIPSFNRLEILDYTIKYINDEDGVRTKGDNRPSFTPYYNGFTGKIYPCSKKSDGTKWAVEGLFTREEFDPRIVYITEIPIDLSILDFKKRLDELCIEEPSPKSGSKSKAKPKDDSTAKSKAKTKDDSKSKSKNTVGSSKDNLEKAGRKEKVQRLFIETYDNLSKEDAMCYRIVFTTDVSDEVIIEDLGLRSYLHDTNMVLFDDKNVLRAFPSVHDIIDCWYPVRRETYRLRIDYLLAVAEEKFTLLSNQCRFIKENIEGVIDVKNIPKQTIINKLTERKYDKMSSGEGSESYDYLLNMKIYSLTKEKYEELMAEAEKIREHIYGYLKKVTPEDLWNEELIALRTKLVGGKC